MTVLPTSNTNPYQAATPPPTLPPPNVPPHVPSPPGPYASRPATPLDFQAPGAFVEGNDNMVLDLGRALVNFLVALVGAMQAIGRFIPDLSAATPGTPRMAAAQMRIPTEEEIATGAVMSPPEPGKRWHVVTRGKAIGVFDDW